MQNILIVGGTGKTGRRITRRLRAAGRPVRAASRTGGDIAFDLADPPTWAPALEGVDAAYVVEPDLRASGDRIPRFVAEAVAAGVRRLVLLSAGGVGEADDRHPLKAAEQAVRASGLDWTILRPDWFAQNFSEGPWLPGILAGTLSLPAGAGRTPFVDAEDIAEVAAAALTEDHHRGRIYQLTGPRAVSFAEAADLIGKATGRPIRYADIAPEAHIEHQVAAGIPAGIARLLTGILVAIRDGLAAEATDDVERALGRAARPFEDYVTETAAAGLWN
ncbi:SDR family oxidoreductase [Amycolatopsis rifamycinica]|uniref:NmrA family transcriptional regulator n=1 Tax=Amycolatopsis rifamycinica TaxID=287986 RepID=A0A066UER3_9PSEU|nr:SDR family oxidoreductase [Amycolatopsis rifamycinica]KDN22634.1 NmrA family transcriptional regulator [Amycolatopsis rifamycinica]